MAEVWPKITLGTAPGRGFAGVAVADGACYAFHRVDDNVVLESLAAATGRPNWKQPFETSYQSSIVEDDGPRCVPIVQGGKVVVYGAEGDLRCLRAADGKLLWRRDLLKETEGQSGYFGAGSTPLIVDDTLIVNAGAPRAGVVGLALATGKTIWSVDGEGASYSAPMVAQLGGKQQAVVVTRLHCMGLDPKTGRQYFTIPFGQRGPTVNAATPIVLDQRLFLTANYGVGGRLLEFDANSPVPREAWNRDDVLSSQYATPLLHKGCLYGVDGRQDVGVPRLRCVELITGKVLWTQEDFGAAHLIMADDKLLALKVDGTLVVVDASPKGYSPLAQAALFQSTVQALPALAAGRLYARDPKQLRCYEVAQPSAN